MHDRNLALPLSDASWRAVGLAAGIVLLSQAAGSQTPAPCRRTTAFGATELLDALQSGAPSAAIARLVTSCGTSFSLNAQLEERFRATGADDGLFAAMRKMSPPVSTAAGGGWTSPVDGSEMVWVEGGTFQMGSPPTEPGRDDDEPEHRQVVANGMWADVAEVTYESFRRFVMAVPAWQKGAPTPDLADSNYLLDWSGTTFPAGRDREPVRWVSWPAARAYAAWAGKRLPTEAEWEYLARAGTRTRYWWGEEFDAARVRGGTASVGDRRSRWGLQDVLGGVWEWTSSLYAAYPYDRARMEGESAGRRTIRGGAVNSGERFVRAANRSSEMPALTSELIGFRCVR
jgi:formylglycine-generating enzyme required for sulfatase activity